jgi:hypothetical protein
MLNEISRLRSWCDDMLDMLMDGSVPASMVDIYTRQTVAGQQRLFDLQATARSKGWL